MIDFKIGSFLDEPGALSSEEPVSSISHPKV